MKMSFVWKFTVTIPSAAEAERSDAGCKGVPCLALVHDKLLYFTEKIFLSLTITRKFPLLVSASLSNTSDVILYMKNCFFFFFNEDEESTKPT